MEGSLLWLQTTSPSCQSLAWKRVSSLAAARLQHWAVLLSAYTYDIQFKPTVTHSNADGLSRLPLPIDTKEGESPEASIYFVSWMECLQVTVAQMQQATCTDPCLSKILQFTHWGWPFNVSEFAKPFSNRWGELSAEGGSVLWKTRVTVPKKLQGRVLDELHSNHLGMSRMKSYARSYVKSLTRGAPHAREWRTCLLLPCCIRGLGQGDRGNVSMLTLPGLSRERCISSW